MTVPATAQPGDILERGLIPCETCGKRHDCRVKSIEGKRIWRTWASPDDGHPYRHISADALASRLEQAEQALREDREVWSFDTLVYVARRLLAEQYPAEVFTGASGDPGPAFVVALRAALAGLAGGDK